MAKTIKKPMGNANQIQLHLPPRIYYRVNPNRRNGLVKKEKGHGRMEYRSLIKTSKKHPKTIHRNKTKWIHTTKTKHNEKSIHH